MGKRSRLILCLLGIIGVVLASIAFWFEPRSMAVSEFEVTTSAWPADTKPLRVVLLSDIHVDDMGMRIKSWTGFKP